MTGTKSSAQTDDAQLRLAVLIYYAILIAGFVVGLYGLISLLSLATGEVERTAHLLNTLL